MKRVTGIGGIFFKSDKSKEVSDWYVKHLEIPKLDDGSTSFQWLEKDNPKEIGYTIWSVFKNETDYMNPSNSEFMINFRVEKFNRANESAEGRGCCTMRRNRGI